MTPTYIKEVEELVLRGQIDEAIRIIRDQNEHDKVLYVETMQLSIRYRKAEREKRLGVLSSEEYLLESHKISLAVISIISELRDNFGKQTPPGKEPPKPFFSHAKSFKNFGPFRTKMIPIFPYRKENMVHIDNVLFEYYPDKIFSPDNHPQFYGRVSNYVKDKPTIYNEAKPHLLDYNVTFSEESQSHFVELELGICGYLDFLSVSRNMDVPYLDQNKESTTIRKELIKTGADKDPGHLKNDVPKQLGVSSIVITKDGYLVLQKRQKSEVASKMYHVSIAEGLQAYPSYERYVNMHNSDRQFRIVDKDLSFALYRGLDEELGIEKKDVESIELLSIYYDYELQQPIFQTVSKLNIDSEQLKQYYNQSKGRDTLAEIGRLDFVANNVDDLLFYFYRTNQDGKWSSHAVINIISFIERFFGDAKELERNLNKYFDKEMEFYLGEQRYVEAL